MPSGKGRYDPTTDYAYDPDDLRPNIGENLGRHQEAVDASRAYARAGGESAMRDLQMDAHTNRRKMRANQPAQPQRKSGGTKAAEHIKMLDEMIKQQ